MKKQKDISSENKSQGINDPRDHRQAEEGLAPDFAKMNLDGDLSGDERGPRSPSVEEPEKQRTPERDPSTDITPEQDPQPKSPPLDAPTDSDIEDKGYDKL